jgi:hypothetical protein
MGTQVTLVYDVTPLGNTGAAMAALINAAAVPLPKPLLDLLGVRIISDAVVIGATVTRTIVLGFNPIGAATLSAMTLDSAGSITSVTANPGSAYILPPAARVVFTPSIGRAPGNDPILRTTLKVVSVTVNAGGTGYLAPSAAFIGGLAPAGPLGTLSQPEMPNPMVPPPPQVVGCVRRIHVSKPGLFYPAGTVCLLEGGGPASSSPAIVATAVPVLDAFGRITDVILTDMGAGYVKNPKVVFRCPVGFVPPAEFQTAQAFAAMAEGTPARAGAITVVGTAITVIAVASAGDGYVSVPDLVISDSAGTGAVATAIMGVGRIDIIAPSKGIPATATVTFTPVFQDLFPSTIGGNDPNQQRPFWRFIEAALMQNAISPIVSAAPLVA